MNKWIPAILSLVISILLITALNTRIGSIPPLGKFLDPISGVWRNALIPDIPKDHEIRLPGVREQVRIIYNDRGVPHIFAENDYDLYYAMGYALARHRLWQMEFSTMAAAGRISEIVGEIAQHYDSHQRRIGMTWGAERIHEYMMRDRQTAEILQAYIDGVNAWISQLRPGTLPLEYKLLDYAPSAWSPEMTAIFYMNMNQTLTSGTSSYQLSTMQALLGREITEVLFPDFPPNLEPIITSGTEWPFEAQTREPGDVNFIPEFLSETVTRAIGERDAGIGSNNWAVSGEKTASGAAMLATDPHLTLSLPAIWYEIQLNAPGINNYGVTLPGVPGIIMGFNEHISWGNTNTGWKGFDIFEVELNDELTHYLHDGLWKPLSYRIEEIRIRGAKSRIDTVYYTHHGPVAYRAHEISFEDDTVPVGHAISWIAHKSTNPVEAFYIINRAPDLATFREGLSLLAGPTQNYAAASINGDILMQTNGLHPVRYTGMGKYLLNGRNPANDWTEFIPFEQLPYELNPARGFVSSANQHTTDEQYPYYLGWRFASEARGTIINRALEQMENITHQDMIDLQLNSDNYRAAQWLDEMLDATYAYLHTQEMPVNSTEMLDRLAVWNRVNEAESTEALVFNTWLDETHELLWAPLFNGGDKFINTRLPDITVSLETLFGRYHPELYAELTGAEPDAGRLLAQSFNATLEHLTQTFGEPGDSWQWWKVNGSSIHHLLDIPALNLPRLQNDGSSESPNAVRNNHGPSWRMVVEMTTPVQAWGVYPGGQTGNPASKGYTAFIDDWQQGRHYELRKFDFWEQAVVHGKSAIIINPAR
ncbi:MAG: penicillin acylase family protein [Bacteroidetes bacterium]|nr:penicillin acylase family protein [Bacteroidota bacterium]